jgi:hypothetical protein
VVDDVIVAPVLEASEPLDAEPDPAPRVPVEPLAPTESLSAHPEKAAAPTANERPKPRSTLSRMAAILPGCDVF